MRTLLDIYWEMDVEERHRKFVDTAAAAARAGVSQRTIELWIACGYIQAIRIGYKYRVDLASLKAYLEGRVQELD